MPRHSTRCPNVLAIRQMTVAFSDRHLHFCIFKIRIAYPEISVWFFLFLQTMRLHFLIKFQLSYSFASFLGFVWKCFPTPIAGS